MAVIKESYDLLRVWKGRYGEGFRLELYDTYRLSRRGGDLLAYRFFHNGKLIFEGDEYRPSPMYGLKDNRNVAGLLAFLSLQPGDTDPEYFEDYTADQLAWAQAHGEELSLYVEELEGR